MKLYEELVSYDPSLSKDKEAVLQIIKKMVAAKPVVTVNSIWREQFSERLADHIAASSVAVTGASSYRLLSKRATSFVSVFLVLVIAGASYWGMHINKSQSKEQRAQLAVDQQKISEYADDSLTAKDAKDVSNHDSSLPLAFTAQKNSSEKSDVVSEKSTQVDNKEISPASEVIATENNRNASDSIITPEQQKMTMMATKAQVSPKSIAIVIIAMSGSDERKNIVSLLSGYDISFVGSSDEVSSSYTGINLIFMGNISQTISSEYAEKNILLADAHYVITSSEKLKAAIEQLKNQGYEFVEISAIR